MTENETIKIMFEAIAAGATIAVFWAFLVAFFGKG